jgi:hypothetical protein
MSSAFSPAFDLIGAMHPVAARNACPTGQTQTFGINV